MSGAEELGIIGGSIGREGVDIDRGWVSAGRRRAAIMASEGIADGENVTEWLDERTKPDSL